MTRWPTPHYPAALEQYIADLPPDHQACLKEILQAASAAREELQVARDKLDRQDEELAAAHRELAEAQHALLYHTSRTHALRDIVHALLLNQSGPETVQTLLSHLRQLLPFVRASVSTFDLQAGTASLYAILAQGEPQYAEGWQGPLEWVWFREDLHCRACRFCASGRRDSRACQIQRAAVRSKAPLFG